MKNSLLLLTFVLGTICCHAQASNDYALSLSREVFHSRDTIPVRSFDMLGQQLLQVLDISTNQQYQPTAFDWTVSTNTASDVWRGSYAADPQAANHEGQARLHRTLQMTKTGDVVVIDNISYASGSPAGLPKTFVFVIR